MTTNTSGDTPPRAGFTVATVNSSRYYLLRRGHIGWYAYRRRCVCARYRLEVLCLITPLSPPPGFVVVSLSHTNS